MRALRNSRPSPARLSTTALGRDAERLVLARYLAAGYREVGRNVRCGALEIDLVVERAGCLVFCEVKSRRSTAAGHPAEHVDARKRARVRRAAAIFLSSSGLSYRTCRFDVACVLGGGSERRVELYADAF